MGLYFPKATSLPLDRYLLLLSPRRMQEAMSQVADFRARLSGRVVWNLSSSLVSGGVAEMIRSLLAYAQGAGVNARWAILQGSADFFRITKRLHNAIHGSQGDGSALAKNEREIYERISSDCAAEFAPLVRPEDIVIVHDPQPAGTISEIARRGAHVIWRCHIGSDETNRETNYGWDFLAPYLRDASAYVFSRAAYVPPQLSHGYSAVIPPSIDPFSAKNRMISEETIREMLSRAGILGGTISWETPIVAQISRWDRLKDPMGVMRGFALGRSEAIHGAHLVLAGPETHGVADDPEGAQVYQEALEMRASLPAEIRARIHLISFPTANIEENAIMVNALQRHASVIVQKSLHEGFGLTVAEAMWKFKPVVASAVGGIQDQVDDGVQGLLLRDPSDPAAFVDSLETLLSDPSLCRRIGENGHLRVLERYLGIDSLLRYGALIESLDRKRAA